MAGRQELRLSESRINRAHEIYAMINSPSYVLGATSSMLAWVTVFPAAKSTGEYISSQAWLKNAVPILHYWNERVIYEDLYIKRTFPKLKI